MTTAVRFDVRAAAKRLAAAGVASADHDARALAEVAAEEEQYAGYVAQRARREPLQHITGVAYFRYLELAVGPGVFIPRPETELVAQAAIDFARAVQAPLVVDLCAGSGAIALSLASEVATATVHAVEIDDAAMEWLRRNADGTGVQVLQEDAATALRGLNGTVDVVVSNPPYLPLRSKAELETEVRDHDPGAALFGGADGLETIRLVVRRAAGLLRAGGLLVIEHDDSHRESVAQLLTATGEWEQIEDHNDLTGRPRFATAVRETGRDDVRLRDQRKQETGVQAALAAVRAGDLVVLPTDTVYGVGADAFSPQAVTKLLAAKGRGRDMPVPVLIGAWRTARALTDFLSEPAENLISAFWPGALTVVVKQGSGLAWDLGDSAGTVALRMPLHEVSIDLLQETGPLAVSSANRTGSPAPTTADDARRELGETVAVYLDGGPTPGAVPSTIVDVTGAKPRILREGVITRAQLEDAIGGSGID